MTAGASRGTNPLSLGGPNDNKASVSDQAVGVVLHDQLGLTRGALAVAEGINNQLRRAVKQQRVALISASSTLPSVAAVVANTGTPAIL